MTTEQVLVWLVTAPGLSFLFLAGAWLIGVEFRERFISRFTCAVFLLMTLLGAGLGWEILSSGTPSITYESGSWFRAGEYAFPLVLTADRLSLPLLLLAAVLVGLVGSFSVRYIHRDRGFTRFFLLLHLFAFGSMLVFSAGSFDLLIAGWELVGITSALLVAFFYQRPDPVRSATHIFSVYRVGDLGLMLGVFVLHYLGGTAESSRLFPGIWPSQGSILTPAAGTWAALLFLFAAAAKSAQVPFFGWLPRAMEGPTPSSAIFYGAISVHAGAYLLLRIEPLLLASPVASFCVVLVGLLTAIVATLTHRVVADAKTSIAYAAMTQLGIIFMEIGLGFPRLALAHMVGHAIVRTLQFLRSPSMMHDYHRVHAAAGGELPALGEHYERILPGSVRLWAYRFALDRGFYDAYVTRFVVAPVLSLSRWLASFEPGAGAVPQPESRAGSLAAADVLERTKA